MSLPTAWAVLAACLALLLGVWLMIAGRSVRQRRGLGSGKTISLDRVRLTSRRLGLTGRPDRLIRSGGVLVIEEWKSAQQLRPWHRAQIGVYFLLAEDCYGVHPTHGFLVTGNGKRHRVDNTSELRDWVLALAQQIRAFRSTPNEPIPVSPKPGQCRHCGMKAHCSQVVG